VGARPAALGSAYSALANDAYAPAYNPGALGFLLSDEISAMHLSYLDSIHYDYFGYVHPLSISDAVGASLQVFSPGAINGTDINGNSIGSVTGRYGAYSLSYAHTFQERWAVGMTGKIINAAIGDAGADAAAVDAGVLYQANGRLFLAATATNMLGKLSFVNQSDPLPTQFRIGAAYTPDYKWKAVGEIVYETAGLFSFHGGVEWSPVSFLSLRAGIRTDTVVGSSAWAGFTSGIGFHFQGQELDYAWVPLGDLGNTQYLSLTVRFGDFPREVGEIPTEKGPRHPPKLDIGGENE
jgi:hypothetical protein